MARLCLNLLNLRGAPPGTILAREPATAARLSRRLPLVGALALAIVLALAALVFPDPAPSSLQALPPAVSSKPATTTQQNPPQPDLSSELPSRPTAKQEQRRLKSNFEQMKRDADELSTLAKSLRQDLDKSNENVLSLKVLDQAEKIEKLARKIKSEAKGN